MEELKNEVAGQTANILRLLPKEENKPEKQKNTCIQEQRITRQIQSFSYY